MPYLLLSLAALFWGGNYVVGHLLVAQVDPILLSETRWLLTAALLMGLYYPQVKKQWAEMLKAKGIVFFLALCGQVLFPVTLYIGLQYTSSLNAAIYLSTTPALVLLINKLLFKETITRRNVAGVLLSSLGVIYLVLQGDLLHLDTLENLNRGDVWTMGSAASWAIYCAFLRLKPATIGGNPFVAVSATLGALILLPLLFVNLAWQPHLPDFPLNGAFLLGLAYLVIFPSWLSYLLWNKGILAIGATRGEIYSHLIPLSGGVLSILFLDLPVQSFHLVSALFIAFGIVLCSVQSKKSRPFGRPREQRTAGSE